jgi:hypothetical protein
MATAISITPPNMMTANFRIIGTAPLVMAKFSQKAKEMMMATQEAGSTARSKKKRTAKDFKADCEACIHYSTDGWIGIPAPAFRAAMISACRLVGFRMTLAKLSLFTFADGYEEDGTPLVRMKAGKYEQTTMAVRNSTGVIDIRSRPMWHQWEAMVRIQFDADQFTLQDISNLMHRVGVQVGLLEGRPDSRDSAGMGWGTFRIESEADRKPVRKAA